MAKQIKYSEPAGYFPKELRDKILAAGKAAKAKNETATDKKATSTKKKK